MTEKELTSMYPDLTVITCDPISDLSMSFKCPWCKGTHTHGRGSGPRASHCTKYQHDYLVIDPSDNRKER